MLRLCKIREFSGIFKILQSKNSSSGAQEQHATASEFKCDYQPTSQPR